MSLNNVNVGTLEEFSRIKKPHKQVYLIGQIFCFLLIGFKYPEISVKEFE